MWEALMMLRLFAAAGQTLPIGRRATPLALPADTLKGAIRLSFAAWRLSLPRADTANDTRSHDQKIA